MKKKDIERLAAPWLMGETAAQDRYTVPNRSRSEDLSPPYLAEDEPQQSPFSLDAQAGSPSMSGRVFDRSRTALDPYDWRAMLGYRGGF
jgi:hypothetical protein